MTFVLHNADCVHPTLGMASLPDLSVDVSLSDAPYSAHVHEASRGGGAEETARRGRDFGDTSRAAISRNRDLGFDALTPELRAEASRQFARVTRRWVGVFCDTEGAHGWRCDLEAAGLEYIRTCLWVKIGCTPQFTGDRPGSGAEAIVLAHRAGKKRWNGGGKPGVYQYPIVLERGPAAERRLHTTQKPIALMLALVRDFTDPGELVLDAFAGSGTTGAACLQLGRNWIGWERDETYAATIETRLRDTREQLGLFAAKAPRVKQDSLFEGTK